MNNSATEALIFGTNTWNYGVFGAFVTSIFGEIFYENILEAVAQIKNWFKSWRNIWVEMRDYQIFIQQDHILKNIILSNMRMPDVCKVIHKFKNYWTRNAMYDPGCWFMLIWRSIKICFRNLDLYKWQLVLTIPIKLSDRKSCSLVNLQTKIINNWITPQHKFFHPT